MSMSSSMASRAAAGLRAATMRRPTAPAAASSSRSAATAATTAAEHHGGGHRAGSSKVPRGDLVPVYVALGMVALSVTLGLNTARQQLAYSPNVWVDKKKRETVPEAVAPEIALDDAERFVGTSLFRKVAHVQDDRSLAAGVAEYPTKKAVTLKDVGVETPGIEQAREELKHSTGCSRGVTLN